MDHSYLYETSMMPLLEENKEIQTKVFLQAKVDSKLKRHHNDDATIDDEGQDKATTPQTLFMELDQGILSDVLITNKLYDRERQVQELQMAYQRLLLCPSNEESSETTTNNNGQQQQPRASDAGAATTSALAANNNKKGFVAVVHRELVLISGPSGTGKTALALSLKPLVAATTAATATPTLTTHSGFFIAGKFDQLQRPEPYAPFRVAFTDLIRQMISTTTHLESASTTKKKKQTTMDDDDTTVDPRIALIRRKLVESVDSISMITDMIPAVKQLLGPAYVPVVDQTSEAKDNTSSISSSSSGGGGGYGGQSRFLLVFCQFVRAMCSPECPLVLFLDDLQWAEPASIELCAALVTDGIPGLMVVGACRGNEVAIEHHLAVTLRELEADRVVITNIEVGNVSNQAFQSLLREMFHLQNEAVLSLASVVHHHTDGNIFFAIEFLKSLEKSGILVRRGARWAWEPKDDILSAIHYNDVVDLVARKIRQLPQYEQEVVKIASCLGCEFDDSLIKDIVKSGDQVATALDVLEMNGFIVKQNDSHGYRFRHDRIQQAALSMIPREQNAAFHLSIGRALLQALSSDAIQANIFLIVNLLEIGVDLIESQEERIWMAHLCLQAGEKASVSSAFFVALRYLNLGVSLLGERRWRDHYSLTLDLTNAAAEVAYCNADYDLVDALTASVLSEARCFDDKVRAYTTHIYSLGSRHAIQRAIDIGFDVLRELGEPFPKKGRLAYILLNFYKTNRLLRDKTADDIVNLPTLHDTKKLAALRIMNLIIPYCLDGRLEFAPLIAMRVIQITMKSGICGMSCVGFSCYAMILATAFGDAENGYRVGRISLAILDRFKAKEWKARVFSACYGLCFTWVQHLRDSLKPLLVAHRVGLNTGDIEFSMLSATLYSGVAWHAGCNLEKLLAEFTTFHEMMTTHKQYKTLAYCRAQLQLVHNFLGKARNPAVLNGDVLDSTVAADEAQQEQNSTANGLLQLYNLILAYYFNEYELSREKAKALARCQSTGSSFTLATRFMLEGMAALASDNPSTKQRRLAHRNLKTLKKYAQLCPANMTNKVYLLEAEISSSYGKSNVAFAKFGLAIDQANKEGILHEKALACERAGIMLKEQGRICSSIRLFSQAQSAYNDWGCTIKAEQMKDQIDSLSKSRTELSPDERGESAIIDCCKEVTTLE